MNSETEVYRNDMNMNDMNMNDMNMNDMNMNDMNMNDMEDNYIKKDLSKIRNLFLKMLVLMNVVGLGIAIIGNLISLIMSKAGYTIDSEAYNMFCLCIGVLLSNVLAYLWFMKRSKISQASLFSTTYQLGKDMWKYIYILFTIQVIGTLCYTGIQAISGLVGIRWEGFGLATPAISEIEFIPYFLFVCFLAPVTEELIFRGAVLKVLAPYGYLTAIIITALFFGIIHGNLEQFPSATLAGILFGYVTIKTGTIYYSIILHMINNIFSFAVGLISITALSASVNLITWGIYIVLGAIGLFIVIKGRKEYSKIKSGEYDDFVIPVRGGAFKFFFKSIWIWIIIILIILGYISSIKPV